MKKLVFLLTILLCACNEFNNDYTSSEMMFNETCKKELQIKYIGQTWGFGKKECVKIPITRSANTNSNEWSNKYKLNVPKPLTQEQKDYITNWFKTNKNPKGITINWTDYFAQQISSTEHSKHMDYLLDAGTKGNDHVNNFNSGDCSYTNVDNCWQDKIMFMQGQSTKDFSYHETMSDKTWEDHYVIIPGEVIDPNNKYGLANMYFLGFDYEAAGQNTNQIVARDYYFDDWIIRISPGEKQDYPITNRVMCEDLGNSYDWDYNDIVFDVSYEENRNDTIAIITLQAVGGTLPIYVGIYNENYEAHKMFGVNSNEVIINPIAPVIYRIPAISTNPKDIPIYVNNGTEAIYVLKAEKTPQKFCCPNIVKWSDEMIDIRNTYPKWQDWVNNNTIEFWK